MVTPELIAYVRSQRNMGMSDENIKLALKSENWSEQSVVEVFNLLSAVPVETPKKPSHTIDTQNIPRVTKIENVIWTQSIPRINNYFLYLYIVLFVGIVVLFFMYNGCIGPLWAGFIGGGSL